MIVRALPSLGKSHIARRNLKVFDTDDMLNFLTDETGKAAYDKVYADQNLHERLGTMIRRADAAGLVLTNFDTKPFTSKSADLNVIMDPDDYISHIRSCGRTNLIDEFGEKTLKNWIRDFDIVREPTAVMRKGEFLEDVLHNRNILP